MSSSTSGNNEFRCNKCGITFTTVQDKEEHMKLEHRESKGPAGVKWAYNAQSNQWQEPTHTSSSWVSPMEKNASPLVECKPLVFIFSPSNASCFVISMEWEFYSRSEMDAHNLCRHWLTHLIRSLPVHEIFHFSNHTLLFVGGAAHTQRLYHRPAIQLFLLLDYYFQTNSDLNQFNVRPNIERPLDGGCGHYG